MVSFGQSFKSMTGPEFCGLNMYVATDAFIADLIQGSLELGELYTPQDWRDISPRDFPDCLVLFIGGQAAFSFGVMTTGHGSVAF